MPSMTTGFGVDLFTAAKKRLNSQGFFPSDSQIQTLLVDLMNVCITDSGTVSSHSTTELSNNPIRPFKYGV